MGGRKIGKRRDNTHLKKRSQPLQARTRIHRQAFLRAYAQLGNVTAAALATGIERKTHYRWLKDATYRLAAAEAEEQATERMEQEAWRRAVAGVDEPVFQGGKEVGTLKKYSDVLLIFLLKARRPDKYRDRYETTVTHQVNLSALTDGEIRMLEVIVRKAGPRALQAGT